MIKHKIIIVVLVLLVSLGLISSCLRVQQQQRTLAPLSSINENTDGAANALTLNQSAEPENNFTLKAGFYDFSLTHDSLERSYILYAPKSYDPSKPALLVLNFHGGGGSAEGHQDLSGMNATADKYGFIVVYPRGMRTDASPIRPFQRFWNPGNSYHLNELLSGLDDIGFTQKILNDVEKKFNIDKKRIYATGFSNGAALVHLLGCALSDRLAAIAPVAAPMWNNAIDCNPARPVSVIHFHGTQDACAPYNGGPSGCEAGIGGSGRVFISAEESINIWREENGCTAQAQTTYQAGDATCQTYNCQQGAEVVLCTIDGGGHAWPGGQSYSLPGFDIGKTSQDISANEAMWQFFQKHSLP